MSHCFGWSFGTVLIKRVVVWGLCEQKSEAESAAAAAAEKKITAEMTPEEMMKAMGMTGFETTKGKHVKGNEVGGARIKTKRTFRQYMNRKRMYFTFHISHFTQVAICYLLMCCCGDGDSGCGEISRGRIVAPSQPSLTACVLQSNSSHLLPKLPKRSNQSTLSTRSVSFLFSVL